MELNSLKYILHPHTSGFTTFVLGVLFVLSIYHFLLYFQNREKVYLFYSLYTFLIFINQIKFVIFDVNTESIDNIYKKYMYNFHEPIVWIYNTFYFVFGFTFLNLKKYSKSWYLFIFSTVKLLFISILIIVLITLITGNYNYITNSSQIIKLSLYIFGIVAYYSLFTVKMPLKKYIIVGSFLLYSSSFSAEYIVPCFSFFNDTNASNTVFYIGVIFENIIFSLGLGQKQKLILQDKNESQHNLIIQLKENDRLRNEIQQQLEQDVATYSKKAEKEKFNTLKAQYEKELLELRMSSLRSQMNPHFIFNSLNSIKQYIISNEKQNAVYYLNKFSKLIRSILDATQNKEIPLADEIETLKLYLNIENIRFLNEIVYEIKIEKNLQINTIKVPSLILQPFIENALWHGLSLKKGEKLLTVEFSKPNKAFLEIKIQDNGIGRKKSAYIKQKKIHKKKSIGIDLTKERLKNFSKDYKNKYSLTFEDLYDKNQNATGTSVIIQIPLL